MSAQPWMAASVAQVADLARAWVLHDELARLVTDLGGPHPSPAELDELRRWSEDELDTRRGAERRDAAVVLHPPRVVDALVRAAEPLGLLRTPRPQLARYDAIVILGGATTGNLLRTRLVRAVLDDVAAAGIVALASDRPISASEIIDDPASQEDGSEWRNLVRHIGEVFGPLRPVDDSAGTHRDRSYRTSDGLPVRLLVPPDNHGRRPTTPMQLMYLRERIGTSPLRSSLLVTSSIYAPYQFFAGAPVALSKGTDHIELVGTPTSTTGDRGLLGQRLAQEIHAGIDAAASLLACP